VIGFNVTSGTISGSTTPTGATGVEGGTSGIVVDNGYRRAEHLFLDAPQPKLHDLRRHGRLRHTNLAVGALEPS